MNKLIIVSLTAFAVINSVCCYSDEEFLSHIKSPYLKELLSQHREHTDDALEKLEQKCPGVTDRILKNAVIPFNECVKKIDGSLTICAAIQSYTLNCTKPYVQVFSDCLPIQIRELPALGVKSFVSVADYLCKQDGESIFELFNPCLYEKKDKAQETVEFQECETMFSNIVKLYKGDLITTTKEVCSWLSNIGFCIKTSINASCKNQKTKKALLGFNKALFAPCNQLNGIEWSLD